VTSAAAFAIRGAWDPSLALVSGGALIPSSLAYLIRRRIAAPIVATRFDVPTGGTIAD